ncbi:SMI1/KNR4 family protein [Sporosarcina sp. MB25]|nr:SMI1/KNR4 family protein [Sporosarcina cyprini]MCG3087960.1 SMI1/KNR4 family protein [Sporosarcina cyprini]
MSGLQRNDRADGTEILKVESEMNVTLPNTFKKLLQSINGLSLGGGLAIYGTEELMERNETWEVREYAGGYVAIGDDGGGNVFLMRQELGAMEVLLVGAGDMNPKNATVISPDLIEWITSGFPLPFDMDVLVDVPDTCRIVLIKMPDEGLKGLLQIKTTLGLATSTADLLKGSKQLPFVLVDNFPYGKAKKLIEELGVMGSVLSLKTN